MAIQKKPADNKTKKKETFHDYVSKKDRSYRLSRLKNLSPGWIVFAVLLSATVGYTAYFGYGFYTSKIRLEANLQKRKFTYYRGEVTIEDAPGKKAKTLFFTEKAIAYLDTNMKLYGYQFPTPLKYKGPDGNVASLDYSLTRAGINGRNVEPEFAKSPKGDIGGLGLQDRSTPLVRGKNVFEIDYQVSGVPLQDKLGNERLTWHFPRARISLVDRAEALIVLPRYAQIDTIRAGGLVINPETGASREAEPVQWGEVILKEKTYRTALFAASNLESFEVLEVRLEW